jgi:hypothetical protein
LKPKGEAAIEKAFIIVILRGAVGSFVSGMKDGALFYSKIFLRGLKNKLE